MAKISERGVGIARKLEPAQKYGLVRIEGIRYLVEGLCS